MGQGNVLYKHNIKIFILGYMTSEAFIPTKQSPEKAPSRRQDTSQAM